jgi:hypothetical protein
MKGENEMLVRCIYCKRQIKATGSTEEVSHGVCHQCLPKALDEMKIPLQDYLEVVPFPALLVDDHGKPVAANERYKGLIGTATNTSIDKSDDTLMVDGEYRGTDTVKMVVNRSRERDEDLEHEHASAEIICDGGKRRLNMLIGTMRVGDRTIVRVEELESEF